MLTVPPTFNVLEITTVWGGRLRKRFCNMFSESSTGSWAELHLPCRPSKQGELPENMLQNLLLNLPPQTVLYLRYWYDWLRLLQVHFKIPWRHVRLFDYPNSDCTWPGGSPRRHERANAVHPTKCRWSLDSGYRNYTEVEPLNVGPKTKCTQNDKKNWGANWARYNALYSKGRWIIRFKSLPWKEIDIFGAISQEI